MRRGGIMMEFVITNDKIKQLTYIAKDEQKMGHG